MALGDRKSDVELGSERYQQVLKFDDAIERLNALAAGESRCCNVLLSAATEIIADALEAERVGVWRVDPEAVNVECVDLYHRSDGVHSRETLREKSYVSDELKKLFHHRRVIASDVTSDPITSSLSDVLWRPHDIRSLLTTRLARPEAPHLIICVASVGETRGWTPGEVAFVGAMAQSLQFALDDAQDRAPSEQPERACSNKSALADLVKALPAALIEYSGPLGGDSQASLVSAGGGALWGRSDHELNGQDALIWRAASPEEEATLQETVRRSMRDLTPWSARWRIETPSGEVKWLYGRGQPKRAAHGVVRLVAVIMDMSESVLREKEHARSRAVAEATKERFEDAISALPDGVAIYDGNDRLIFCNEAYANGFPEFRGLTRPGTHFSELVRASGRLHPDREYLGREEEWIEERLARHRSPKATFEKQLPDGRCLQISERRTSSGDTVIFRTDVTKFKRDQTRILDFAGAISDLKSEAEFEALHDPVTGLPNRRRLDRKLAEIQSRATASEPVYLLHVDIDRFQEINDAFGHAIGDYVLQSVADRLRLCVPTEDLVVRIGGDEFAVLCNIGRNEAAVNSIATRVVMELTRPVFHRAGESRLSASIGVAQAAAKDASALLTHADIASFRAKGAGPGRIVGFTPQLEAQLSEKRKWADDILRAIEADEFRPVFQPQFDALTLECVGLEALARWAHPTLGVLSPDAFLDVARDLNVVDQLDRSILRKALLFISDLMTTELKVPKISVNVSLDRILDDRVVEDVRSCRPDGARVAFELPETIYFDDDHPELAQAVGRLRDLGVELEIDDFGSGRASALGLLKIGPDRLKIDRELVSPIGKCPRARELVDGVIRMGQSLGIGVTAEGVETSEHVRVLREIGCDTVQGYFLARPMTSDSLIKFLKLRARA